MARTGYAKFPNPHKFTFVMDQGTWETVEAIARKRRLNVSDLVNEAVEAVFRGEEK